MRGSVLSCLSGELFLIGSYSSGKSDEYYYKAILFAGMVKFLNQYIAWLSLLVAVLCYHFEKQVRNATKLRVLHASLCP